MSDTASSLDLDAIEAALTVADRKTDIFDAAWAAVRRLRAQGDTSSPAPGLAWTKERPTKEGWYWVELKNGVRTVQVRSYDDGSLYPEWPGKWEFTDELRWAGPIPEPGAALAAPAQAPAGIETLKTMLLEVSKDPDCMCDEQRYEKLTDRLWDLITSSPGSAAPAAPVLDAAGMVACPFCGQRGAVNSLPHYRAGCWNARCVAYVGGTMYRTEEAAVAAWNTRAAQPGSASTGPCTERMADMAKAAGFTIPGAASTGEKAK